MPPINSQDLPPKLKAVLLRLGKSATLNTTQAVKLPYFVDVIANYVLGYRITEGTHEAWQYGVVTAEVWRYLNQANDSPILHMEPVPFSEEKRLVIDAEPGPDLTPDEQRIVDFVAEEFTTVRAVDLGRITKLMNPDIPSWGSSREPDLGEDAYDRMSQDYLDMAEAVAAVTLDRLRRESVPVEDIEDAVA
jgi:uncharacterized phage-associated protein